MRLPFGFAKRNGVVISPDTKTVLFRDGLTSTVYAEVQRFVGKHLEFRLVDKSTFDQQLSLGGIFLAETRVLNDALLFSYKHLFLFVFVSAMFAAAKIENEEVERLDQKTASPGTGRKKSVRSEVT